LAIYRRGARVTFNWLYETERPEGNLRAFALLGVLLSFTPSQSAQSTERRNHQPPQHRLLVIGGTQLHWAKLPGETLVLRYAFLSRSMNFREARNCRKMHPIDAIAGRKSLSVDAVKREIAAGLAQWSTIADVTFREIENAKYADILIGVRERRTGTAFADVFPIKKIGRRQFIRRSLICFNGDQSWKIGFNGNLESFDLRYVAAHESGHAIGLDHPSRTGQVMSFKYTEQFRFLQPGDVFGAVRLYGRARKRTRYMTSHVR
jgi:hypothetical protein